MRTSRTRVSGIAVALAGALVLTACGGDSDGGSANEEAAEFDGEEEVELTFTFWGDATRADYYEQAIDVFEDENPGVTVQSQYQAWEDYWTSRNTEAAGGSLPDVMQMDLSYLREFASNDLLRDLNDQLDVNIDLSGYDESLVESGRLQDSLYAVPISTNTLATFYNPDLLEQIGMEPPPDDMTWDEYFAWLQEAGEAGASEDPAIYGGIDPTGVFWVFLQQLMQEGTDPFTEDGALNFTEEDMKAWLESGSELRESGSLYPIDQTVQLAPLGGFTVEEAVSEMSWDNFLAGYTGDTGNENLQMVPLPHGEGEEHNMFFKPSMLLAAGENTENPDAAAAFIDFMVTDTEVAQIFGTSRGVPADQASREALELEEGSVDERVMTYEDEYADLVTETAPLPVEGFGSIEAEYLRLTEELNYGNITVDEFVETWFSHAEGQINPS